MTDCRHWGFGLKRLPWPEHGHQVRPAGSRSTGSESWTASVCHGRYGSRRQRHQHRLLNETTCGLNGVQRCARKLLKMVNSQSVCRGPFVHRARVSGSLIAAGKHDPTSSESPRFRTTNGSAFINSFRAQPRTQLRHPAWPRLAQKPLSRISTAATARAARAITLWASPSTSTVAGMT